MRAGLDAADRDRARPDRAALRRRRRQGRACASWSARASAERRPWPRVPGIRGAVRPALAPAGRRAGELAALSRRPRSSSTDVRRRARGPVPRHGRRAGARARGRGGPAAPAIACACGSDWAWSRSGWSGPSAPTELVLLPPGSTACPSRRSTATSTVWLVAFLAQAQPAGVAADPLRAGPRPPARGAPGDDRGAARLFPGLRPRHAALAAALLELWPAAPAAAAGAAGRERRQRPPGRARSRSRALGRGGGRRRYGQLCAPRGSYKPLLPEPALGRGPSRTCAAPPTRPTRTTSPGSSGARTQALHRRGRRREPRSTTSAGR